MLTLNTLKPVQKRTKTKRFGRGPGSGLGKTAGRGHKGQRARAGGFHKVGFEGGQMPLQRRLPKQGFTNVFRKRVGIVNLEQLASLPKGTEVTLDLAKEKGWVSNRADYLKVLGVGELKEAIKIKAYKISQSAQEKVEKAGGTISLLKEPRA